VSNDPLPLLPVARISHVVLISLPVLVLSFAMVATVRVAETQVEVSSKESELVAPDSPRSSNNLESPCLRCSIMEWFQGST